MTTTQHIFNLPQTIPPVSLTQITTTNQSRPLTTATSSGHNPILGSNRFLLPKERDYNQQYFNVYRARLETCRVFFQSQIQTVLDEEYRDAPAGSAETPIWTNLPEAKPGQKCVVIGVSYKNMEKRPSVLDNVGYLHQKADNSVWKLQGVGAGGSGFTNAQGDTTSPLAPAEVAFYNERNYCTEADIVHLEDGNGRVPLLLDGNSRVFTHFSKTLLGNSPTPIPSSLQNSLRSSPTFAYLDKPVTAADLISGVIMGAEGELSPSTGEFRVSRLFFPSFHFEPMPSPSGPSVLPSLKKTSSVSMVDLSDDDDDEGGAGVSDINATTLSYIPPTLPTDTYIAFVSGINLAALKGQSPEITRPLRSLHALLTEFLSGQVSNNEKETTIFSKITDCVIAGDLIGTTPPDALLPAAAKGKRQPVVYTEEKQLAQPSTLQAADLFLTKLCSALNVYLLPGSHDPTNYTLPQQPFHRFMFPSASTYRNFHLMSNPIEFSVPIPTPPGSNSEPQLITLLGTDGSNVNNITKHSSHSVMSSLALIAQSQHIAPTAPDTLGIYPYQDIDPLAFNPNKTNTSAAEHYRQPDIIFAGNAPHFQAARVKVGTVAVVDATSAMTGEQNQRGKCDMVDLISIPNFSTTGSIVLMNSRTKQCIPVYLNQEASTLEGVQQLLYKMNLNVSDEQHAVIEFGDDDDGEGGDDDGE